MTEEARHLPDGRRQRRPLPRPPSPAAPTYRVRHPLLRPASGRSGDSRRRREGTGGRNAYRGLPRVPRRHPRAHRRHPDHPDDLRVAARGLRLGALRDRCPCRGSDELHHRRHRRRLTAGVEARPARRPHLDRRADRARRLGDRRLALPRDPDRDDRRTDGALGGARRARSTHARATDVPIYAGFGISTPGQARAAADLTDGVVVGSRAVLVAEEGPDALGAYVSSLRAALDS